MNEEEEPLNFVDPMDTMAQLMRGIYLQQCAWVSAARQSNVHFEEISKDLKLISTELQKLTGGFKPTLPQSSNPPSNVTKL